MRLSYLGKLIRQYWPYDGNRAAVIAGYRVLGSAHLQTLADIGLRNYVFSDTTPDFANAVDPIALAIAEGRRRAALEIFQLARVDYMTLLAVLETKKPTERGDRT